MTFRTFENGIRIAKGFASDPADGKVGDLYWNTSKNLLRQCVVSTPTAVWEDVSIKPGTAPYSTLYWDNTTGQWTENVLLLTNGRNLYAASSATSLSLTISAGDTTDPGTFGSDLVLEAGSGPAGTADVLVISENFRQQDNTGTDFNITSADSTNAAGNNLNLSAGQGSSEQGNLNLSGEEVNTTATEVNINATDKIRLNGEVVFSQILASDPFGAETGQIYWNITANRF